MTIRGKHCVTAVVTSVAAVGAFIGGAQPASASGIRCTPYDGSAAFQCVDSKTVLNFVEGSLAGVDLTHTHTIYILQCRGDATGCVPLAPNSKGLTTRSIPTSFGHVYKSCATFTSAARVRHVNVCTAFTSA